jgi:small GTP-binding protein
MRVVQKKVCLLGDFAVGKTSLVRRFVEGKFDERYLSSIGVTIWRKSVARTDYMLNFMLWDLAGGDDLGVSGKSYLAGATGALIVCDLTRAETVATATSYAEQLRVTNPGAVVVFAANKMDLVAERAVSDNSLEALRNLFKTSVLLSSAKTGENVESLFDELALRIESSS